jgi:hypothetical protein
MYWRAQNLPNSQKFSHKSNLYTYKYARDLQQLMVYSMWKYTNMHLQNLLEPRKTELTSYQKTSLKAIERQVSEIFMSFYFYPFP